MNIKRMVEAGEIMLEEAILEVLMRERLGGDDEYLSNSEIIKRTGICTSNTSNKYEIAKTLLEKLRARKQVSSEHKDDQRDEWKIQRSGWKLSDKEYKNRTYGLGTRRDKLEEKMEVVLTVLKEISRRLDKLESKS